MRAIVWLILLFVAAVVAAAVLGANDGLVTVFWAPWRVDVSLNFFVLALVLTIAVAYVAVRGINGLIGLPRRAREWRLAKRERSAQQALRESLALFFGARYTRAHKAAERALTIQQDTPELREDAEFTMLAHLLAAGSMHRLQDRARREEHLSRALAAVRPGGSTRAAEEGARLMAAEWALDDRDADRALELIAGLSPGVARRTQALRLKLQAARYAQRPLEALRTARLLAKHQGFSPSAATGLLRSLAIDALETARDADQLRRVWQQLDATDRRDVYVVARAATLMARMGGFEEARAWLRPYWEQIATFGADERAELSRAFVASVSGVGADWLPRLEAAVAADPGDPALAHALGSALAELQLWGKARQLLERCAGHEQLAPASRRAAWRQLAELAERDGDLDRAQACYRHAARIE
ncbi:heme biosynthesis HemY N-terminal domain-containing protein [Caldimonas thermodepolymerans]|uniref:heme biosynthesis HemY N-terminal domain-containing protein n=1 Tax=Caldimonas thermodepolymerans TaxID=215580 RepID=UPI0022364202|nr:heme biosynthesis HemY N-terminal domain-containing protein [Caldimonas thermodepolymerans]UZG43565.1 heme biosynthesis protein HemY [Caldimonas thermodepolymerans]